MRGLEQLNPFNHLFGRIFIGFWLLILMLFGAAAWVFLHFDDDGDRKPANLKQVEKVVILGKELQNAIDSGRFNSLKGAVSSTAKATRNNLVVVNLLNENVIYSMREREQPAPQHIIDLSVSSTMQAMILRPYSFIGPGQVIYNEQPYAVFIGRKTAPSWFKKTIDDYPIVILLLPIFISSILCMVLAWSLSRPLRDLRYAVRDMRKGNLSASVNVAEGLNDEISHLGRDFNRMSEQISGVLAGQRRLLADISHELRTPLARLNLVIGIAGQNNEIPDSQLQRIEKEAKLIDDMVGQILQLSRLSSDTLPVNKTENEIAQLMRTIIADADYEANALSKSLNTSIEGERELTLDIKLMTSAIENIVRNGIKYSKQTVTVALDTSDPQWTIITIEDDGNGLPEEELETIFDPFFRANEEHNRSIEGFGLGLAIAYRAIKLHSGDLTVENIASGGLRFTIKLPANE